jgi:hypothetical protein
MSFTAAGREEIPTFYRYLPHETQRRAFKSAPPILIEQTQTYY